ncbi:hypothetical protein Pla110_32830 [Polystyrenella longa]|uniref:Uncharacterized protein n=1 Tax=Polystyrenella longa TaxID=2528007 RepID=A0A518CQN9_9PLAN|nr:hypothetical protein [Polystyrenella longa]QDU81541.1 hypothetical protein Pla110_32830 [Polystyrenella longa]
MLLETPYGVLVNLSRVDAISVEKTNVVIAFIGGEKIPLYKGTEAECRDYFNNLMALLRTKQTLGEVHKI